MRIENDTEIVRYRTRVGEPKVDVEANLTAKVAFGDCPSEALESIDVTLERFLSFISSLLHSLATYLP